jgi:hypothetical protein
MIIIEPTTEKANGIAVIKNSSIDIISTPVYLEVTPAQSLNPIFKITPIGF